MEDTIAQRLARERKMLEAWASAGCDIGLRKLYLPANVYFDCWKEEGGEVRIKTDNPEKAIESYLGCARTFEPHALGRVC